MNKIKKTLIASFFAILMLMMPLTTIAGSVPTSSNVISSEKETKYLITFSKEEIKFLGALLDRMLRGEIKLTESEIVTVKGIRNKLTCEKVELTRSEIKFLLEIFCRITDGEMKLTDYETKILKSILSKISDVVVEVKLSEGDLKYLEEVLDLNEGRIKLTATQITQLEDLANSFEDVESRTAAHKLVDQLVTAEGELDLAQVKLLFSGDYQPTGIVTGLIKEIIKKITNKIMEILLLLIQEYLSNRFSGGRSGWIGPTASYFYNVTIIIQTIQTNIENIKDDIDKIRNSITAFIDFWEEPTLMTLINLIATLIASNGAIRSLFEDIENLPITIRTAIENLYVNTTIFALYLVPDLVDPENYVEADRAYNQPIQLNVKISGIEPDKMQNVEIYCDYQIYTPSPDGLLEIEYDTFNKAYPYWIHITGLTVTDKNTNPHRISTITDDGFSYGHMNIAVNLSGRPDKPYGPTEVIRFDTHLYETRAINPSGADSIYYQWDWGEYMGVWYGPRESGNIEARSHTWLMPGKHVVRVRASDNHGWVSDWSEPLTVTVYRKYFPNIPSQSQQNSQTISNNEILMNSMTFNLMEMMAYGQPNAN